MRPRLAQLHQSGATNGQVPTWDNTAGMWVPGTPSGGSYTDPLTTKGDLVGRSSSATGRVPVGTDGFGLVADSTQTFGIRWADLSGLFVPKSLVDAKGDVVTATANDTPARLAVGADGTILTADSTQATGLRWGSALSDPSTTKGDLLARSTSALNRLGVGSDGQVLTADSAQTLGVRWATPASGGGTLTPTALKTANYTAVAGDLVRCSASGGSFTVTLPSSPSSGNIVGVKREDFSGGLVTVAPSSGTIDGASSVLLFSWYEYAEFMYNGSEWARTSTSYRKRTVLFDDFAGTGALGDALTTQPWANTGSADWARVSGAAKAATNGTERFCCVDAGTTQLVATVKILTLPTGGGDGGVQIRSNSTGSAGMYLNIEATRVQLYTHNTSFTSVGTLSAAAPAANDVWVITADGSSISLSVNGGATTTLTGTLLAGTQVAFRHSGGTANTLSFDYLAVREL